MFVASHPPPSSSPSPPHPPPPFPFDPLPLPPPRLILLTSSTVAKRKTLFDDRPIEISELTYIIRQDISSLNTSIAQLQSFVKNSKSSSSSSGGGGGKGKGKEGGQVEEHNSNVVMMLQSRLASMGMGFKDVLELRTQVSVAYMHGLELQL